jgi:hypothetical protein
MDIRAGVRFAFLVGAVAACSGTANTTANTSDDGSTGGEPDGGLHHEAGQTGQDGSHSAFDGGDGDDGGATDGGLLDGASHDAMGAHDGGMVHDGDLKDGPSPDVSTNDAVANDATADVGVSDAHAHDAGTDSGWVTAVPSGMPQVTNYGGPVLAAPILQSISFSGYDQVTQIDDFVAKIGSTAFWHAALSEYGVGAPTVQSPVHLTATAPTNIDDSAIQTWLAQEITSGKGLMAPSNNALYVISYPATTTVTLMGAVSCMQFGGYHNSVTVSGIEVAYAVLPECSYLGTALQTTTAAASHELAEAATDPHPLSFLPTYGSVDQDHLYMAALLGGGEIGDLCAQWQSSFYMPSGFAYEVQRPWSNAAAVAGHDPCQPELPGEVFFNAVPLLTDTVNINYQQQPFTTLGAQIALGGSKTIPVQLYSDGPIGPWSVSAVGYSSQGPSSDLSFSWDKTTGQNGDTLHLTITVSNIDPNDGGDFFLVQSTLGTTMNSWVGYVSN